MQCDILSENKSLFDYMNPWTTNLYYPKEKKRILIAFQQILCDFLNLICDFQITYGYKVYY